MAGFCLAGISAAAIRGKKKPSEAGPAACAEGGRGNVSARPGPCARRAAVPWLGQDVGTEPALPLYSRESQRRGRDLVTGVSFPRGGRPRWLLSRDLAAWFEGRNGDAAQARG